MNKTFDLGIEVIYLRNFIIKKVKYNLLKICAIFIFFYGKTITQSNFKEK